MKSRDLHSLLDVLLAAENARSYVGAMTYDEFFENGIVRDAVLHCLTVIQRDLPVVIATLDPMFPDRKSR